MASKEFVICVKDREDARTTPLHFTLKQKNRGSWWFTFRQRGLALLSQLFKCFCILGTFKNNFVVSQTVTTIQLKSSATRRQEYYYFLSFFSQGIFSQKILANVVDRSEIVLFFSGNRIRTLFYFHFHKFFGREVNFRRAIL